MRRRSIIAAVAGVMLVAGGCSSAGSGGGGRTPGPLPGSPGQPGQSGVARPGKPRVLVSGLAVPWAVAFLPGGDALVTERDSARLLRVTPRGGVRSLGTVPGVVPGGEAGLLGVAVSPTFTTDHYVYLYFTSGSDNRIVRFAYTGPGVGRLQTLVTGIPHGGIHNGGRLAFGPDKMLYAGTGETGSRGLAQDRRSPAGKILRMTPDGKPAPGNPYGSLVWSYGHRNVQGLAWDDGGRMYATEFGQDRFDEINRIQPGHNYGWPKVEGVGGGSTYTDPLLTWPTSQASPSGLAYDGGSLWAAALGGQRLWQIPLGPDAAPGRPVARFEGTYGRLRAAVRAPDGSLWITTSNRDGRGAPNPGDDKILVIPVTRP